MAQFEKIIGTLKTIDYSELLNKRLEKQTNSDKSKVITEMQQLVISALNRNLDHISWDQEVKSEDKQKDRIDILGLVKGNDCSLNVIIEIDNHRADQVSKKFVSRLAAKINDPLVYVALCYQGSKKKTGFNECIKYFCYIDRILKQFSTDKIPRHFIGIIVTKEGKKVKLDIYPEELRMF